MTVNTGRPNASGHTSFVHLFPVSGPEYRDAIAYLEPAALRRLGISLVHATDAWAAALPDVAADRLANAEYFELAAEGKSDALYRVLPAFLQVDSRPNGGSFEALRRAVPSTTTVYLSPEMDPVSAIQVASALSHARVVGEVSTANLHPLTGFNVEPLGDETPDVVVTSTQIPPTAVAASDATAIWRNDHVAVYAPGGSIAALMPPPASPAPHVTLSGVEVRDERIGFAATFANPTSERWTSQDWVVLDADATLWAVLQSLESGRGTTWFAGQIEPRPGETRFDYRFLAAEGRLLVRSTDGTFSRVPSSGSGLGPGRWWLVMRLRDEHRKAHLFPLIRFEVLADGEARYDVVGEDGGIRRVSDSS